MKKSDILRLKKAVFRECNLEKTVWQNKHYNEPKFLLGCIYDCLGSVAYPFLLSCLSSRYKLNKDQIEILNKEYGLVRKDGVIPRFIRKYFYHNAKCYGEELLLEEYKKIL